VNEADVTDIYQRLRPWLVRLAEANGAGNKSEDVVQTVFVLLWEHREEVTAPGVGWLRLQIKWTAWGIHRREKHYAPIYDDLEEEDGIRNGTPDPRPTPDQNAQHHEAVEEVKKHLHGLTLEQRELLEGYGEGLVPRGRSPKLARLITSAGRALRVVRS